MRRGWWWKVPVIVVVGWLISTFLFGFIDGSSSGAATAMFVTCDSTRAKDTLKQAFDQSQFARQNYLSAVAIHRASEVDYKRSELAFNTNDMRFQSARIRVCRATVTLNNAQSLDLKFRMSYKPDSTFMLVFWDASAQEPANDTISVP